MKIIKETRSSNIYIYPTTVKKKYKAAKSEEDFNRSSRRCRLKLSTRLHLLTAVALACKPCVRWGESSLVIKSMGCLLPTGTQTDTQQLEATTSSEWCLNSVQLCTVLLVCLWLVLLWHCIVLIVRFVFCESVLIFLKE